MAGAKRQVTEFPRRARAAAKHTWDAIKKVPDALKDMTKGTWKVIKEIPSALKDLFKGIWNLVKAIPGAVKHILLWVWELVRSVGQAIASAARSTIAFLHTILASIVTFFRNLTFLDIWNGLCDILSAIVIDIPKAVWAFVKGFGEVSWKVLVALLGELGKVLWYIAAGIFWLVNYVPRKIGEILASMGSSFLKGCHEVVVWVNPKA